MGPDELKIVIAGGFGVGKTTFVGALSEIPPLVTEEVLTDVSQGTDSLQGISDKTTTTVAMDFGRITFTHPQSMILFLFGTPGQQRFWFMWDDLCLGAIGAVVLVDTRHVEKSFAAIGYFEERSIPFVVAVNQFADGDRYGADEVRDALEIAATVPVLMCDARNRHSVLNVVIALVTHALTAATPRSLTRHGAHA
ncbi:ATP/GTP-binding protein (plasmid) [Actinacidiphila glaucinigra]|nr:ATP/GTP-binding protein [Actinacidiphila glaucinigra]WSD65994.1 ATP/GTP-binding protein [Actinacidiphila glaucinigra]